MDWLITGRVRGTFGLEGFIKIESCSGEYEHFLNLKEITLRLSCKEPEEQRPETSYQVEECVIRSADALLKLRGINSPEAAKKLRGADILVPRDMACPLERGEFYINDLCNSDLVYKGNSVGTIADVVEGGGGFLLEVSEAATGRTVYVPFRSQFIGKINIPAKQVELMHRWILE